MRASEKSSISTNRKSPRAFQRAIDEPCTLPLSPPEGGTKRDFAFFSKFQLLSKKSMLQSFLILPAESRSCIIPLSNSP